MRVDANSGGQQKPTSGHLSAHCTVQIKTLLIQTPNSPQTDASREHCSDIFIPR